MAKDRAKKVKEKLRKQAAKRRRQALYPEVELVGAEHAPPNLVAAVRRAIKRLDFEKLESRVRGVLQLLKQTPDALNRHLVHVDATRHGLGRTVQGTVAFGIGQQLVDLIGADVMRNWVPYNMFRVRVGSPLRVRMISLRAVKSPQGTLYFARKSGCLIIEGTSFPIGWSRHALDQLCNRITPKWPTYIGLMSVWSFLRYGVRTYTMLPGGEPAFVSFYRCTPRSWHEVYAKRILGVPKLDPKFDYYYRMGYCPIAMENRDKMMVVRATTLLPPGFRQTPEHQILRNLRRPRAEREKWLAQAERFTTQRLWDSDDTSLLKLFHDNGVPQILMVPVSAVPKQRIGVNQRRRLLTKNVVASLPRLMGRIEEA